MVSRFAVKSTRRSPVKLGARQAIETEWRLTPPPGFRATSVPSAAKRETPFGSYAIEVERAGAVVRVRTRVSVDRARVAVEEYDAFRAFCEDVDRHLGQTVTFGRGG
jgi:hypothetical protein